MKKTGRQSPRTSQRLEGAGVVGVDGGVVERQQQSVYQVVQMLGVGEDGGGQQGVEAVVPSGGRKGSKVQAADVGRHVRAVDHLATNDVTVTVTS